MNLKKHTRLVIIVLLVFSNLVGQLSPQAFSIGTFELNVERSDLLFIKENTQNQLTIQYEAKKGGTTLAARQIKAYVQEDKYYLLLPSFITENRIKQDIQVIEEKRLTWDGQEI